MTEQQLQKAEEGIELLSEGTGFTEKEIVEIIQDGLAYKYKGMIPVVYIKFLEEITSTFDAY